MLTSRSFCLHLHSAICLLYYSGKVKAIEDDQMIIDAGQKIFGPKTCAVCNTVYHPGNKEDEDAHKIKHDEVCLFSEKKLICAQLLIEVFIFYRLSEL